MILDILYTYGKCSKQQINRSKTTIFFSKSTSKEIRCHIKQALGVLEIKQYEKYLGLPFLVGRNKKTNFNYVKERVWKKKSRMERKIVISSRKGNLNKGRGSSYPPMGLCNDIESLIRKFWWGQNVDRRKIHWVKWETLFQSKFVRGMSFKDLVLFNEALLVKQAWRLLHNKDSLFYRVFKSKFFPSCSIMETVDSSADSYAWHSILKGRDVLLKGARRGFGSNSDHVFCP